MIKQKSFTLIELLVVIVIIGILAGVIMISTSSSIDKANFAKAQAFSSTIQNELLSNLVSEWTFDNASNIGEDTWGNNHGTLYNFANPATTTSGLANANECVFGTCLKFDGVDDYVRTSSSNDLKLQNYTFSVWVKAKNFNQYHGIMEILTADNNYVGRFMTFGQTSIRFHPSYFDNGNAYVEISNNQANEWIYLVGLYNGAKGVVYKNGSYVGECDLIGPITYADPTYMNIGKNANMVRMFSGLIDDVRVYDTTLSSSQIKGKYIAGLNSLLVKGIISSEEYNKRIEILAQK
ncbi:MAG: LamG-like jellyroll fold domain-containing protein [Minisyncoccales bacterium]